MYYTYNIQDIQVTLLDITSYIDIHIYVLYICHIPVFCPDFAHQEMEIAVPVKQPWRVDPQLKRQDLPTSWNDRRWMSRLDVCFV